MCARTLFAATVGAITGHALASRRNRKQHQIMRRDGPVDRAKLWSDSLQLLIEGEQKLLALFDARQASADGRMTAAATGALALPAATLALAKPLERNEDLFKKLYAGVVRVVALVFVVRMLVGWKTKKKEPGRGTQSSHRSPRRRRTRARSGEGFEGKEAPVAVQQQALKMWRTRAQHSRDMAQIKDVASLAVALLFVIALGLSVAMVAEGDFWTEAPTATDDPA
jgi:hypothetical protein